MRAAHTARVTAASMLDVGTHLLARLRSARAYTPRSRGAARVLRAGTLIAGGAALLQPDAHTWCAPPRLDFDGARLDCNWSTYEWVHNQKRNRLDPQRAEKLVRCFSNINLLKQFADFMNGFCEWDEEMLVEADEDDAADVDDDEQMVLRSGSSPSKRGRRVDLS